MTHIEESRDSSDKCSSFRCAEELPSMTFCGLNVFSYVFSSAARRHLALCVHSVKTGIIKGALISYSRRARLYDPMKILKRRNSHSEDNIISSSAAAEIILPSGANLLLKRLRLAQPL